MKSKIVYFLMPIAVLLGSIIGNGINMAFSDDLTQAFNGFNNTLMLSSYILLTVLFITFCLLKYMRMKKLKKAYTLCESIIIMIICAATINIVYCSFAFFGSHLALLVYFSGYFIPPVLSFIVCFLWLKENDRIAETQNENQ